MSGLDVLEIVGAQMLGTVLGAIGIYVAIRVDLAQLNARLRNAEEATLRAHDRIDAMLQNRQ